MAFSDDEFNMHGGIEEFGDDLPPRNMASLAEREPNIHIYGHDSALAIDKEMHRSGAHTIGIDAAEKKGNKVFWDRKIRFQATPEELPVIAAVLMGFLPECEFKFHGRERNKSLAVMRRANAILFRVSSGGQSYTVAVPAGHAFGVSAAVMCQVMRNSPGIDGTLAVAQLKSIASLVLQGKKGVS